jgi:hypothetical protein
MTGVPDNLPFNFRFAQLGFRADWEDRRFDDLGAIFVIGPKFNIGALAELADRPSCNEEPQANSSPSTLGT